VMSGLGLALLLSGSAALAAALVGARRFASMRPSPDGLAIDGADDDVEAPVIPPWSPDLIGAAVPPGRCQEQGRGWRMYLRA